MKKFRGFWSPIWTEVEKWYITDYLYHLYNVYIFMLNEKYIVFSVYDIAVAIYMCTAYRYPEIYVVYFSVIKDWWHNLGLIAPKLKKKKLLKKWNKYLGLGLG